MFRFVQNPYAAAALAVLGLAGPASGKALEISHVAAAAKWGIHLDVDALKDSGVGRYALREVRKDGRKEMIEGVAAIVGFDPLKDLHGLTIYGSGEDENAVALVHGKFQVERLVAYARLNETYVSTPHRETEVHLLDADTEKPKAFAFHGDSVLVIAPQPYLVKDALDVIEGMAEAAGANADIKRLRGRVERPVLLAYADLGTIARLNPKAAVLKQAKGGGLVLGEVAEKLRGTVLVATDSAEKAVWIKDMINGYIAMGMLNEQLKPHLQELRSALVIESEGPTLSIDFHYPVDALLERVKALRGGG